MKDKTPTNTFEEYALLVRIVKRVQKKTGVKGTIYPSPVNTTSPASIGEYDGVLILGYLEMVTLHIPPPEMEAIIAHELGHIANGDVKTAESDPDIRRTDEDMADEFAAKHGYADSLIAAFQRFMATGGVSETDKTHSPIDARIARLRAFQGVPTNVA